MPTTEIEDVFVSTTGPIAPQSLRFDFSRLGSRWMLLAAGDYHTVKYNAMTVSWGSFGNLWNLPFVQIFVRPTRYTMSFLESGADFTLSLFPADLRPALSLLGSRSGRDGDKIAASGLTPRASVHVAAPSFAEAELVLECKKMYSQDLDPSRFLDPLIESHYPEKDYHRVYFGQILGAWGGVEFGYTPAD